MPGPDDLGDGARPETGEAQPEEALAEDSSALPGAAQERMAEMRAGGISWGSGLSTAELAAVRGAGFEPAGLVMGSSIYHVAWQGRAGAPAGYYQGVLTSSFGLNDYAIPGGFYDLFPCPHGFAGYMARDHFAGVNWERTNYERGIEQAYLLAVGRLVSEAKALGAHGVVGVRLTRKRNDSIGSSVEFTTIGTAVRRPGAAPLEAPFTSHLSGQDFAKLMAAGYVPAGLVLGLAVIEAVPGCGTEWQLRSWSTVELAQYTDAIERCQAIAVDRLEQEAAKAGEGVVGVDVDLRIFETGREARAVEIAAIGTAVRRFAEEPLAQPPLVLMKLRDR